MFIDTKVAKVIVAKVMWQKLCGESYMAKVSMVRFVAKVIVPQLATFLPPSPNSEGASGAKIILNERVQSPEVLL
jgi:hypothetical protein